MTLVILGLNCWICEFLVKFFAVCVFVNLGLPYFGACEFGSSLFSGRGETMRGGAVRERGGISCPDHRGGVGSGIDGTCAGRVRVTHDPVPIRPVVIPGLVGKTKIWSQDGDQQWS